MASFPTWPLTAARNALRRGKEQLAPLLHRGAHSLGASILLTRLQGGRRILMYHGVAPEEREAFAHQLRFLAARYSIVSLDRLLQLHGDPSRPPRGEIALTFDDGLRNNVTEVYPLLEELGLPATFYLCPGLIEQGGWIWTMEARLRLGHLRADQRRELASSWGLRTTEVEQIQRWMKFLPSSRRRQCFAELLQASAGYAPTRQDRLRCDLMNWEEVKQLDPRLVTIGSHTLTHPMLAQCSPAEQLREIAESQQLLQRRLQRPIRHFCYPDASSGEETATMVRAHYDSGVCRLGVVRPTSDLHRLPRIPAAQTLAQLSWRLHRPGA